ncbi:C25 family cysteine peptidase [Desulfobacterium sp. N47]|uniref:C25 family cysteine peptidase n=1 Tax=Desulfobacterium sp. N47 TaxID=3115210 RepID=UPI003CA55A8F
MEIHIETTLNESESFIKINFEFNRTAIKIMETQMGARVTYANWHLSGPISGPGLPAKTLFVALPQNTRANNIETKFIKKIRLAKKPFVLAPMPPYSSSLRIRPGICVKQSLYRKEKIYTRPLIRLIGTRWIASIPIAVLEVNPVALTRMRHLDLASRIEGIIHLEPVSELKTAQEDNRCFPVSDSQSFRNTQLAKTIVINPEDITHKLWQLPSLPDPVDYLIITDNRIWDAASKTPSGTVPGDLVAAFSVLKDWRSQTGLRARVVTVSDIVNDVYGDFSTGSKDLQNIIRKFLRLAHDTWGVTYVLLGGDQSIVPIRTLEIGWWKPSLPTDFYYSNLSQTNDWQENQNINGNIVDYNNDISIGRVPVSGVDQANTFVNKVIAYEQLRRPDGIGFSTDWLHRVLFVATSWDMSDHSTDILRSTKYPPGDNRYHHTSGLPFSLIKLIDELQITQETDADKIKNNQPDENRFCHTPGNDYIKIHIQLTCKDIDNIAVQTNVGGWILQKNANASKRKPGWYFDNNTLNWILVYGIPDDQVVQNFIVHLKKEFREPQNLLSVKVDGDYREIPYDHQAKMSKFGWFYAKSQAQKESDLYPSELDSLGLPVPTLWIAVYDSSDQLDPLKFIFDPKDEEGSMADQEVLRKQVGAEAPEWDLVSRLYEDVVDLPPVDRYVPEVQYYSQNRLRNKLNQGQHIVSLSGHGNTGGCCDGFNTGLADALANTYQHSIFYADSCLTNRYTEDSLSKHLVFNPAGGAVAYMGYMDEISIGLGKSVQQTFFHSLTAPHLFIGDQILHNRLGIAFDATRLALQQNISARYNAGDRGAAYTIIMMSLLGDPALKVYQTAPLGFAAFYTNQSILMARYGHYVNTGWNDTNPLTHMDRARHESNQVIIFDLTEKFRLQYDRQLGLGIDHAADFFANSVLSFINAGISFSDSSQEADQNSIDFNHHRTWAKNNLDYAGIRLGTVRTELLKRVSDACSYVLQNRQRMIAMVYTFESVMMGEIGGFSAAFQADNSIDPNSYKTLSDFAWAMEYLIKKYEHQLHRLKSVSGPSEFLSENFYADVCLRLYSYGVLDSASTMDRNYYLNRAKSCLSIPQMKDILAALVRRLFIELYRPEEFSPQVEIRFSGQNGEDLITNRWSANVVLGHIVTGKFKIYNQGGGELKITSWKFSDDFNSQNADFSIPEDSIYFGHALEAEITFHADQPGNYSSTLILNTSNPEAGTINIYLIVHVASPNVEASPAITDFGRVRVYQPGSYGVDGSATKWIFLINSGDADAYCEVRSKLENESPPGQFCHQGLSTPNRIFSGDDYAFPVTYSPTSVEEASAVMLIDYYPAGRWDLSQTLQVQLHGIGFIPEQKIALDVTGIDYGLRVVNQEYHKQVTIMNQGDANLILNHLDIASPGATDFYPTNFYFAHDPGIRPSIHYSLLPITIPPEASQMIDVVFYPTATGLAYNGTLTIESNDPRNAKIIVTLTGITAGQGCYVQQEYINFGSISSGDASLTKDVVIQSQGTTDLTILDILFDPLCDAFSINNTLAPMPKIMHPGESAIFRVVFNYTFPGQYNSWLKIISDDPNHPTIKVRVVGVCK